jgi:hypothetical protein
VLGQQYNNSKDKVLNMSFGSTKYNRDTLAKEILAEAEVDSVNTDTSDGVQSVRGTLAETKKIVDGMRSRSLGARQEFNEDTKTKDDIKVADIGKGWLGALLVDEESKIQGGTEEDWRSTFERYIPPKEIDVPTQGLMTKPEIKTEYTPEETPTQDMLDRIAFGEGANPDGFALQKKNGLPANEYELVYGHGKFVKPNKPLREMTLAEVEEYQIDLINATKGKIPNTKLGSSAVGKYQVLKDSLFGPNGTAEKPQKGYWAEKLGLTKDTVYTAEVQERIGRLALKEAGFDNWMKREKSEEDLLQRIADIWSSVEGSEAGQGTPKTLKSDLMPMINKLRDSRPAKLRGDK